MADYLLHTLGADRFEARVAAICDQILGMGTETFSSGKDEGVDAFFEAEHYRRVLRARDGGPRRNRTLSASPTRTLAMKSTISCTRSRASGCQMTFNASRPP